MTGFDGRTILVTGASGGIGGATARQLVAADRGGLIVNVSSQASPVVLPGHVSYGASKAALDSITRVSALELGRYGIRVNSVNPTVVMTPMSASYWAARTSEAPIWKRCRSVGGRRRTTSPDPSSSC